MLLWHFMFKHRSANCEMQPPNKGNHASFLRSFTSPIKNPFDAFREHLKRSLHGSCSLGATSCVHVRVCAIRKLYINLSRIRNLLPFPDSSNYCAASNNNKSFLFKFSSLPRHFQLLSRQLILYEGRAGCKSVLGKTCEKKL
jgi:hypothetical protein